MNLAFEYLEVGMEFEHIKYPNNNLILDNKIIIKGGEYVFHAVSINGSPAGFITRSWFYDKRENYRLSKDWLIKKQIKDFINVQ